MNEKEKAMRTSSKVISVIMKIGYIAMIVAMSICAVCLIFMAVTGGKTSIVTPGGTNIMVADGAFATPEGVAAICASMLVSGGVLFAIFFLTHRVFNEISTAGTPFNPKYVKTIKIIGVLVAVMGIVGGIVDSVVATFAGTEALGVYTNSPGVIVGVVIFCLAYVFDYVCSLQKEA